MKRARSNGQADGPRSLNLSALQRSKLLWDRNAPPRQDGTKGYGDCKMGNPRLIRKYVNRRLYDTVESRYVNLEDLRRLVAEGSDIQIVDQATGRDITSSVLLHIIASADTEGGHELLDRGQVVVGSSQRIGGNSGGHAR